VLTSSRWTPFAFGTAQHTAMVEIEAWPRTPEEARAPA
jgi:hypothetical protein